MCYKGTAVYFKLSKDCQVLLYSILFIQTGREWDYDWTLPNVQRDDDITKFN